MKKALAFIALISALAVSFIFLWKGSEFFLASRLGQDWLMWSSTQDTVSLRDAFDKAVGLSTEFGWSNILKFSPLALAYLLGGSPGLSAVLVLCMFLTLTLVFLIAQEYVSDKTALFTVLIFALSPLTIKFPYDTVSPFSSGLLGLLAIYMAIVGVRSSSLFRKAAFWLLSGAICILNWRLVGWGIWLPIFIGLAILPAGRSVFQKRLMLTALAIWLITTLGTFVTSDLDFYVPETPLRTLLTMPEASQHGYSDIIPRVFSFTLQGNNPAIIIVLAGLVLTQINVRPMRFAVTWLILSIAFNFSFLQAGIEEISVILMFPMALIIATFFADMPSSWTFLGSMILGFLLFSVLSSMEPRVNEVIVSLEFPGWKTAVPFRDLGQIFAGLLPISVFLFIASQKALSSQMKSICLGVIFSLFGFSQISLMTIL